MKMKATNSNACEPLLNVRRYGAHANLTPSEVTLINALVEHGGVAKAARSLGFGERSTSARIATIREKLGAVSSKDAIRLWIERRDAA